MKCNFNSLLFTHLYSLVDVSQQTREPRTVFPAWSSTVQPFFSRQGGRLTPRYLPGENRKQAAVHIVDGEDT